MQNLVQKGQNIPNYIPVPKLVQLPSDWIYDTNNLMTDVHGSTILACKSIESNNQFWISYYLLKNVPSIVPSFLLK